MHTLVKLLALSAKILYGSHGNKIKICRFHGSLSQKDSRPLVGRSTEPIANG